jgi:membrane-associated protease RseP (regulator of RpoE activity)
MSEDAQTENAQTEDAQTEDAPATGSELARWRTPVLLFGATFLSTLFVGANMELQLQVASLTELFVHFATHPTQLLAGWTFAVPLMAILLAHEMGHYVAGRIHRVDISPPYFIPMPIFLLGTMGAVIRMRGAIRTRNALLDVGAAGPLAGMVVALPVLVWGLHTSEVKSLAEAQALAGTESYFVEGRGLLYLGLLQLLKDIPAGHDVWLNPTAMAGWAGLLVTQINLIPVGQLDGGHVAYALFGPRQDRYSALVHRALPVVGIVVSLVYVGLAWQRGVRGEALAGDAWAGAHWLVWALLLGVMSRFAGATHPPTGPEPLSRGRRWVAVGTLVLFLLLFMPSWIYVPSS